MGELVAALDCGDGNPDVFDAEWRTALESNLSRWLKATLPSGQLRKLSYFEHVKGWPVDQILAETWDLCQGVCWNTPVAQLACRHTLPIVALMLLLPISLNGLRLAHRNAQLRAVPSSQFVASAGDVFHLPFADASFDVVMSYGLLEHFTEPALVELLAETNRVLRPGGLHIVDIIHGRWSFARLLPR